MPIEINRKSLRNIAGAILTVVALSIVSQAQTAASTSTTSEIKIKNFGQMDERFYRGARPKEEDFKDLAALGIKTIIDLTEDPKAYEKTAVEAAGMTYLNIPMIAKKYPTPEATAAFLKAVEDPNTGKFFLHCAGGRHRTGAMGAVYRYKFYDWDYDKVYKEMKQYDFYTSWGHGAFKDFVKDYYDKLQTTKAASRQPATGNGAATGVAQ